MSILGDRIRALRESKAYQQTDFAKKIDVTNVTLSRYETGERKPDYNTLQKIADYFEVSIDYLLGRTNIAKPIVKVMISNEEIMFSIEELELFNELKKYPILLNDLSSNPTEKVKELIKLYKIKNVILEEEVEYGYSLSNL